MHVRYVFLWGGLAACVASSNDQDADAMFVTADDASREIDRATRSKLSQAGFAEDEIRAVGESVVMSRRLSVQSFVKEANESNAAGPAFARSVRRESHGKAHACLRARFDVTTRTGSGVFQERASYPAWVRISNGGAYQRDDKAAHISRGWGIKLLGVSGTPSGTQDFLFITSPRFFIHDIRHYPNFLRSTGNGRIGFIFNALFNMSLEEKAVILHRLSLKVSNLLESPEYSAVPYSYGNEVVKYALSPCGSTPPITPENMPPPDQASDDYLTEAMDATLRNSTEGVCYDFFVQRPSADDSVENPTRAWTGEFEAVARITIPLGQHAGAGGPADHTAEANVRTCESMAFDPFNSTEASRPIGKTNLTRKVVYKKLAAFRRTELPDLFSRWRNRDDTVPAEYRNELNKLGDPESAQPIPEETREPTIDNVFRSLGIVR